MALSEAKIPGTGAWGILHLARSRAQIYGVLSAICGGLPAEQLTRLLTSWSISDRLADGSLPPKMKLGLKQIKSWLEKPGPAPSETALETEFTRLFRGLGRAKSPPPPYESVYMDGGLLWGPSTQLVADIYQRFELKAPDNEPPDYIALEMDFMRFLCDQEAAAWERGNPMEILREEEVFLGEHLASWMPAFCENVRRSNTSIFFTGLANLIEGWIMCDRKIIRALLHSCDDTNQGACNLGKMIPVQLSSGEKR